MELHKVDATLNLSLSLNTVKSYIQCAGKASQPRGRDTKDGPTPFFYSFFFIEKNSVRSKGNTAKKKIDTDDLDFIFSPFFFLFFYWWTVESGALFFLLLFDFFF